MVLIITKSFDLDLTSTLTSKPNLHRVMLMLIVAGCTILTLTLTFSLTLTLPVCLWCGGVELGAYIEEARDDGVDGEVVDAAWWQSERRPTYRTRHGPFTGLLSEVRLEAGGTERVD